MNIKNKNGITLIALVVTLIIILILVSITLAGLNGRNGLIKRAQDAKIYHELGKLKEAIETYKYKKSIDNIEQYTDKDLEQNTNLIQKLFIENTWKNIWVFKDLKEIDTSSSIGKGYAKLDSSLTNKNSLLELDDVFAKDLTNGKLFYIKDQKIWCIDGSIDINTPKYEIVEGNIDDWDVIENDDNTVTLVKYKGEDTDVIIPNVYNKKRVKGIGWKYVDPNWKNHYWNNDPENLDESTIINELEQDNTLAVFEPDSVQENELWGKHNIPVNTTIKKITISGGIEEIGFGAFFGCVGAQGTISIPDSVTKIDSYAFYRNTGLTGSLQIGKNVETIGEWAFSNCTGFTGDLIISDSVREIKMQAFQYCDNFKGKLQLGNNLETIGLQSFRICTGFTGNLIIPNSVKTIKKLAFQDCTGFNGTLTLGRGVKIIEEGAFLGCSSLKGDVIIPSSVESVGGISFSGCTGLNGELTIENSKWSTIESKTFEKCNFSKITIPASIKVIGDFSFGGDKNLETLVFEDISKLETIKGHAFDSCTSLSGIIKIPSSIVLKDGVFNNTQVTIERY